MYSVSEKRVYHFSWALFLFLIINISAQQADSRNESANRKQKGRKGKNQN